MKAYIYQLLIGTAIVLAPMAAFAHEDNHAVLPEGVVGEIETTNVKMKFDNVVIRGAQIFNGCDEELS